MLFFADLHLPSRPIGPQCKSHSPKEREREREKEKGKERASDNVYDVWLASREMPAQKGVYLVAGAQRQLNVTNARLAYRCLVQDSAFDFVRLEIFFSTFSKLTWLQFKVLWGLNPVRTTLMMSLNIVRSLFPAFRGYSQVGHCARRPTSFRVIPIAFNVF
jgi:hypothetical protein